MAVFSWSIILDDQPYQIELDHGIFSGKRIVQVNGVIVHRANKFFDVGTSEHPFQIGSHNCKITIHTIGAGVTYNLYVDEKPQGTQKFTTTQILRTMPIWGWLLQLVNAVMLFLALTVIFTLTGSELIIRSAVISIIFFIFACAIWIISGHKAQTLWIRIVLSILLTLAFSIIAIIDLTDACICRTPV